MKVLLPVRQGHGRDIAASNWHDEIYIASCGVPTAVVQIQQFTFPSLRSGGMEKRR